MVLYDSLAGSRALLSPPPSSAPGDGSHGGGDDDSAAAMANASKGLAWYTCGPTVYDSAHLGHARTYVCLDAVRRVIEHRHRSSSSAPPPLFVMNVTDVDDKILARALELGVDPLSLARKYEAEFWQDMDALNVLRPNVVTRVTEHVDGSIVPYVERIVENGMAYVMPEGDSGVGDDDGTGSVYFDVRAFEAAYGGGVNRYGKLGPPPAATKSAADGGDFFSWDGGDENGNVSDADTDAEPASIVMRRKRDPRDFVLWKSRPAGSEADSMSWNSPWGPGRPGWHIECSAMIDMTMEDFPDHALRVHAGGIDLKFPHHTNEIAQAEAYRSTPNSRPAAEGRTSAEEEGEEWIPHWVHTGHLHIRGLKMSKSLKNFVTIREMLRGGSTDASSSLASPADDFRLWCLGLSGSYRGPATYSPDRISEARSIREGIVRFLVDGEERLRRGAVAEETAGDGDVDDVRLPPARWGEEEFRLSAHTSWCAAACEDAASDDLDGTTYVRSLISLSDAGRAYLTSSSSSAASSSPAGGRPPEALRDALRTVRRYLALVGFTDATVRAGVHHVSASTGQHSTEGSGHVPGGERALAEELVRFRASVRALALADVRRRRAAGREGGASSVGGDGVTLASKYVLRLCDDLRDRRLPALGVEIDDAGSDKPAGGGDDCIGTSGSETAWRFCVPRTEDGADGGASGEAERKSEAAGGERAAPALSLDGIEADDLFKVGQYAGTFLVYDASGMPLRNADGTEVSKRLAKKLAKKREKHLKRLAKRRPPSGSTS